MAAEVEVLRSFPNTAALLAKAAVQRRQKLGPDAAMPDRRVLLSQVRPGLERLAAYSRLCGFTLRNEVPATWLYVVTFPVQLHLMASEDSPFGLAGVVHVTNEMKLYRPVQTTDALDISVRGENLRPHSKGATFDMVSEIRVGDELAWESRSNYLSLSQKLPGEPAKTEREEVPDVEPSQRWRLPADLGQRYAAVSSDVNPIHLHPLTSKLMGFPRPIIHGMWTHGRAMAVFGGQLPPTYRVRVQFTKPLPLPGSANFGSLQDGEVTRFLVTNKAAKPCLVGSLRPL